MQITDVNVILTCPGRNYVFLKIVTDEPGLYGIGEGTLNGSETIVAEALRHVGHLLIGRDPQRIEDTWHLIYRQGYWRGGPIFMAALAAIDMALWDIKGKQAGLPVYQLLGGKARDGVMCYSHAGGRDAVETEDHARRLMADGFKVVRCQVGPYGGAGVIGQQPPVSPGTPATSIYEPTPYLLSVPKLFAHLRDKLGMEIELFHDAHEQLNPIEAARLAKELEPFRLFFLEDPLMPEHRESWPLIRAASTTPLAIGEIFTSRWDCLPLFMNRWIDFIRIKPLHVGGITEARKIAHYAQMRKLLFTSKNYSTVVSSAACLHLLYALPNGEYFECDQDPLPWRNELLARPAFRVEDGHAIPSNGPGLGVELDETALEPWLVDYGAP